jgi:predicted DsbA family dithiol-disulfide isomerase
MCQPGYFTATIPLTRNSIREDTPAMIRLDILSDVACPWCYVGKAFLDRALEQRAEHPFQLNPGMPPGGMGRDAYLAEKFGSRENIVRAHEPLLRHAAEAGVEFDLPAIRRTPNTLDAHRLIHWAGLEGRQTPMVGRLMRAYWSEGQDVGDPAALAALAGEVGLDAALIRRLLSGDADRDVVAAREAHARGRGVNAVPTFILADRNVLQGAQPVGMWLQVIDEPGERLKESMQ